MIWIALAIVVVGLPLTIGWAVYVNRIERPELRELDRLEFGGHTVARVTVQIAGPDGRLEASGTRAWGPGSANGPLIAREVATLASATVRKTYNALEVEA